MIYRRGWAASILKKQNPKGYWESGRSFYRPKYTATNWQLLVLSDLGLTLEVPSIKRVCELYLNKESKPERGLGGRGSEACFTGNLTRMMIRFGYADDPRIKKGLDWLVKAQKEDGGWHCFNRDYGTLDCWEPLAAFDVLPRSKWTRGIRRAVESGAEFYLERELHKMGPSKYKAWFRLHYPWHYYYDLLVGLDVLTSLGYSHDKRLKTALDFLREKRRPDGTWAADATHPDLAPGDEYGPFRRPVKPLVLDQPNEPSKWITFLAMRVLKQVDGGASN